MRSVVVLSPGLLTTVQDTGRWGYQRFGVAVAGAMDLPSHRLANLLVGNHSHAATLEVTVTGPTIRFDGAGVVAVAGARFDVWLDGIRVNPSQSVPVGADQTLSFGRCRQGRRAYLAVAGGFETPVVLGSRSTHIASGTGGLRGRALEAGDRLPVGRSGRDLSIVPSRRRPIFRLPRGGATLRAIPGPDRDAFDARQLERFFTSRFVISPRSNRMGYRLEGPPLEISPSLARISTAVPVGSVQIPGDGQPILLMADHQTSGGYPRVATVITADVPLAAQLTASDWVEFEPCTEADALTAHIVQERRLLP